jgi:hypothetical protein
MSPTTRGDVVHLLDFVDPDLEWTYLDPSLDDPEPQTCHGRGELETALQRQAERGLQAHLEEVNGSDDKMMVVVHPPASTRTGVRTPTTQLLRVTMRQRRVEPYMP